MPKILTASRWTAVTVTASSRRRGIHVLATARRGHMQSATTALKKTTLFQWEGIYGCQNDSACICRPNTCFWEGCGS